MKKAIGEAKSLAVQDLNEKFDSYVKKWYEIHDAAQKAYDKDTGHGRFPGEQANWDQRWEKLIDPILKDRGWKK